MSSSGGDPDTQASALGCAFSFLWALVTLPIWIGALVLLLIASSTASKLFAIALLCLLPIPLNFRHWDSRGRRVVTILLLLAGLGSLVAAALRAPVYEDNPEARARVLFRNETTHHRYSPANIVPELDQHVLGSYLFTVIDPSVSWSKAARFRQNLRALYESVERDPELKTLPSVLDFAYRDMFLAQRPVGNVFVYLPDSPEPKPAIVFLHGSLGNFQGYWQIWKEFADEHRFAIVAPTFGAGDWHKEGGMEAVADALAYCREDPRIDAERLVLAGVSNGGTGVSRAAKDMPEAWQGIVFLSPVLERSVIDTREFANAWAGKPTLIISGSDDLRTPADHVRKGEEALVERGVPVESHYLEGEDHFLVYSDWPRVTELIARWIAKEVFPAATPSR